jgi:hypothetical protein
MQPRSFRHALSAGSVHDRHGTADLPPPERRTAYAIEATAGLRPNCATDEYDRLGLWTWVEGEGRKHSDSSNEQKRPSQGVQAKLFATISALILVCLDAVKLPSGSNRQTNGRGNRLSRAICKALHVLTSQALSLALPSPLASRLYLQDGPKDARGIYCEMESCPA